MAYWGIVDNRKQGFLHLLVIVISASAFLFSWSSFGLANGIQIGLIVTTLIIGFLSYIKQFKSRIGQSIEKVQRVRVGDHVIEPTLLGAKTWGIPLLGDPPFTVLRFKLYEIKEGELAPADMEKFLKRYYENPEERFENPEEIAKWTDHPLRVDIRFAHLDSGGLRIRTETFESPQLRRLAEQIMWEIHKKQSKVNSIEVQQR